MWIVDAKGDNLLNTDHYCSIILGGRDICFWVMYGGRDCNTVQFRTVEDAERAFDCIKSCLAGGAPWSDLSLIINKEKGNR